MADNDYLHTAEIMKAAIPYVDVRTQTTIELVSKLMEFMGSYRKIVRSSDLAACGFENRKIDVEALLTGLRPSCNDEEREFVDRILGIYNAKRMFETYNTYMSAFKTMQESGGFPFGGSGSTTSEDPVGGNYSGFNFDSIFGGGSDSASTTFHANETKASESQAEANQNQNSGNPASGNSSSNKSSSGNNNAAMFEMLKTMVPPEQMSTFENLSMLFNTMSYDNNSKSDANN